ncbi:MAG: hypothetical protein WCA13_14725 [Terriglobales bacterium]
MEAAHLRFANYHDLEADLLPKLRGRVFHVTTTEGYAGIQRDGFIGSNANGEYPLSCSQSKVSNFRKNGCVSLVDLRNISDEDLDLGLKKYYFLDPSLQGNVVSLILSPDAYQGLISSKGVGLAEMIVPELEAGYQTSIPLRLIEEVISVEQGL